MAALSPLASKALEHCSTQWLKTLLRELLPQIIDLPDTPAGHRRAQQWDSLIKERMTQRGLSTLAQQKNPITDVRRVIKAIDSNHPALDDIGFNSEEWTDINMPSEEAVAHRSAKPLDDPDEIARRASVLLQSDSWSEIAAGLAVATGRRAAEVIQTAQFEKASKWSVWFTGAVKRRGEPVSLRFELPTLVEAGSIVLATKTLRQLLDTDGMSNREINRAYSNAVAQVCDRTFADLVPTRDGKDNLYTHLFRSVYSTIATFWYCPPQVPELEFRASIQGHYKILEEGQTELRRSLAASRHYFDYEIADKVIAAHKGQRKGVKIDLPGVEVISAFRAPIEVEPQEKPAMGRVSVTEEDKQRVLDIQEEMNISTQHAAMQMLLDAADTAIALADVLECQPVEVADQVEQLLQRLEHQKQQGQELQAKLSEAEQVLSTVGNSTGTSKVIEQSLSMAHEFNDHLKQENARLRGQLTTASQEAESLRSQLARFEASQQQLQQLQQLFTNGGINLPAPATTPQQVSDSRQPTASAAPAPVTYETRQVERTYANQPEALAETLHRRNTQAPKTEESYSDQTDREVANLIREIMQYNDQQAADDSERWMINQSTLKRLTTRNQAVIKRVLEEEAMAAALAEHHNKYGLHGRVANRGKDINLLKAALGIQR
ncbi:MAG: protelomerase family protein [Cyanobacteria bacterium J06607_10]